MKVISRLFVFFKWSFLPRKRKASPNTLILINLNLKYIFNISICEEAFRCYIEFAFDFQITSRRHNATLCNNNNDYYILFQKIQIDKMLSKYVISINILTIWLLYIPIFVAVLSLYIFLLFKQLLYTQLLSYIIMYFM